MTRPTYMYKGALRLVGDSEHWGALHTDVSEALADYGYTLSIVPHMNSYAAQDEKNKVIYLARSRRGKTVSFQDAAWSAYHDLGHVVDERTDTAYVQDFIPTITLERACDRFGLHQAIRFMAQRNIPHTLRSDDWKAARYSTPKHVAEWLEGFNKGRGFEQLDQKQVHAIADALGISWDNDKAFMDMSERVTSKRHLDDMGRGELWKVVLAMVERVLGRPPDMTKESAPRLSFEKTAGLSESPIGMGLVGATIGGTLAPDIAALGRSAVKGKGVKDSLWSATKVPLKYRAAGSVGLGTLLAIRATQRQKTADGQSFLVPAAAIAGATGTAAALVLARPALRGQVKAMLKGMRRGGAHFLEKSKSVSPGAKKDGKLVADLLRREGVNPEQARIAISGVGGVGKSDLSKVVGRELDMTVLRIDEPGYPQGRRLVRKLLEGTAPLPKGSVVEQTHLLHRVNPDMFDVLIRVGKPIEQVEKQLLARGRGAGQLEFYNYPKLDKTIRAAFGTTAGKTYTPVPHIEVKIKPPGGFQSDKLLNEQLTAKGIDPTGLTRQQRVLGVATGNVPSIGGIFPFLRKGRIAADSAIVAAGGAGAAYAANRSLQKTARFPLPPLPSPTRAQKVWRSGVIGDVVAVTAIGVGVSDLHKARGLAAARGKIEDALVGGEHEPVSVASYVKEVDPSITVVNTPKKVDKMMEKEFGGKWKPFMREVLKSTIEYGDNAFAYRGTKGDYVIGTGKMPKAVVDHEIGHIQDFRDRGIHMKGGPRLGEYVTGYLDHFSQVLSKKRYMGGRHQAEVEAWKRAPKSKYKKELEELGLETYEKGFHKSRATVALLHGVPHFLRPSRIKPLLKRVRR